MRDQAVSLLDRFILFYLHTDTEKQKYKDHCPMRDGPRSQNSVLSFQSVSEGLRFVALQVIGFLSAPSVFSAVVPAEVRRR
jgi:hypothetical protein